MLTDLAYKLQTFLGGYLPFRSLERRQAVGQSRRGRALVSYLPLPLFGDPGLFRGHSNVWESSEIVRILGRLGYVVDVIGWQDSRHIPPEEYDLVFDIHRNLLRYSGERSRRVFHVTGSHPDFSNRAEQERLEALWQRRGVRLRQRRGVAEEDLRLFSANLEAADLITLIGNDVTAATFPDGVRPKIRRVSATGSFTPGQTEPASQGRCNEFLWFNGVGAVHKGLDLVLELFARNPRLTLHVVGPFFREHDFVAAYRHELTGCPNILPHGFLYPGSAKFRGIVGRVRAFINPTCSEGISTSSITCMQYGLIPILSKQAGITLTPGMGRMLEGGTPEELEQAVQGIASLQPRQVDEQQRGILEQARSRYSRPAFTSLMEQALSAVTCTKRG